MMRAAGPRTGAPRRCRKALTVRRLSLRHAARDRDRARGGAAASGAIRHALVPASITRVVAMPDGHTLTVPAGFTVSVFADKLQFARFMALAPNGDVFLAEPVTAAGRSPSSAMRTATASPSCARRSRPDSTGRSVSRSGRTIFTSATTIRWFASRTSPDRLAAGARRRRSPTCRRATPRSTRTRPTRLNIPLNQTRGYNHWTRNVIFNPAGTKLYVTDRLRDERDAGERARRRSSAPRSTSTTPTAPDIACSRAGCGIRSGSRCFRRSTTLWTSVNERDHLGDDLVPDFITSVRDGGFYGWPYSYIGRHVDPTVTPPRPDLVAKAIEPDVLLTSHSAALGLLFYTGSAVPGGVPQQRVRRAARIDQSLEARRATASCACRSATAGRPARPRISSPASSPATTRRSRCGAGRWACCSCRRIAARFR